MADLIDIRNMSEDELKTMLEEVRLSRKTSFERKKRKSTRHETDPLATLAEMDEEGLKALLEEMQRTGLI